MMFASLRKTLVDSHVAAVIVAVLLFASIEGICFGADHLVRSMVLFIQLYVNNRLRDFSSELDYQDPFMLFATLSTFALATAAILCAWLVSYWAYDVGPLRSLAPYRDKITRKFHA
jgi:hypothetical protein